MYFNDLQLFEYALSVFSENSKTRYKMIVEYNGKLLTGKFLPDNKTFPEVHKYKKTFKRDTIWISASSKEYGVIQLRHKIVDTFVNGNSNKMAIPDHLDLINAINSLIPDIPSDAEVVNNFHIATNVKFLETNLSFDFYRFPDDAQFNVVSLQPIDK
ncbi:hypothetical protein [Leuconostoc lactis]|uniref:hypothetical protein n=1 Tax=Leuconostoc lactis TaxID=1246 RepID=UPI00189B43F6|nr:hypothetical protein [Leuconostoc lactis]